MFSKKASVFFLSFALLLAMTPLTALGGTGEVTDIQGTGDVTVSEQTGNDNAIGPESRDNLSPVIGDDSVIEPGDDFRSGLENENCPNDLENLQLASCTTDLDAPSIKFPATNSSQIEAGSTAIFRWVASDPDGVSNTWGQIGGPPGWIDWCGFTVPATRIDGNRELGTYELQCEIPSNAVNERYTLYVSAADANGNSSPNWAGFEFSVVNGSSDNQVPEIQTVRLPKTVSVGETFAVDVGVKDQSGTTGVYVWFLGAAPYYYSDQNGLFIPAVDAATLISGDSTNGAFRQNFVISSWAPLGTYSVLISIRDSVGNRGYITTEYFVNVTQ